MIGICPGEMPHNSFIRSWVKEPSNRILHKLFDDDNYNVTKDELQSPLSY